jgi:hypothetical protein
MREMNIHIWGILISVIAIVLTRSAYGLLNPEWTNTDAFAHFNIIREIKQNGHRPPEDHSQTLHPGKFTYPPTVHILLSAFPERYLKSIDRIFSPTVDLLFGVLLSALVPIGVLNTTQAAVALGLFVATPQFVRPDQPHGVGLSSRKPGVLVFSTGMVAFLSWLVNGNTGFLIIALAAGTLLPLTSRFSTQAFFFITLCLSVFYTPLAITYFIGSLVLALVFSGGYYWRVLSAHVLFSADFAKTKQYKFLYDGYKSIDTAKRFLSAIRRKSMKGILESLFDSIILRSLFDNPVVIPAIVAMFIGLPKGVPQVYYIWLYAGLGTFVITSFYHLRFLGHAGRYLEHTFVPSAIVVASALRQQNAFFDWLVYIVIFIGISTIVAYIIIQQRWTDTSERDAFESLVGQLQSLPTGRILIQPRYGGSEIAWKTTHAVNDFLGAGFDTPEAVAKRNQLYPEKEGWVTDDTAWLSSEFSPDWIVFDRQVAENSSQNSLSEPDQEPYWMSEEYALYKFESSNE